MMEMFGDLETWGIYAAAVLITLIAVLLPMSAYAAQKWAHKTYLEVRSINGTLQELLELARSAEPHSTAEEVVTTGTGKRREPTLGP